MGQPTYQRRTPETTVLYRVVQEYYETLRYIADANGKPLPKFVEREFREYLKCGILAYGFARVHCNKCKYDRLVALSCKGRGICPSCVGRQMNETAAFISDYVVGDIPTRQWVLTVPKPMRYLLAYDHTLCTQVLRIFLEEVFRFLRRRAKKQWGLRSVKDCEPGAITVVQRFDSALALNVHMHSLVTDGVYVRDGDNVKFRSVKPPGRGDMLAVAWATCQRVRDLLRKRGIWEDAALSDDPLWQSDPVLAQCYSASIAGVMTFAQDRRLMRIYASTGG